MKKAFKLQELLGIQSKSGKSFKYQYIDSIRGIAILGVILIHVSQAVEFAHPNEILLLLAQYGQMGVQLFFVASALTLCLSHERRSNEPNALQNFAIRRVFRIVPAYYIIGLLGYFLAKTIQQSITAEPFTLPEIYTTNNVLAHMFFVHGFHPPSNNSVVPGGWSIGTEMIFYVLFPLLFLLAQNISHSKVAIFLFPVFLLTINLFYQLLQPFGHEMFNNSFIYFSIINQLPAFAFGFVAFYSIKNKWLSNIKTSQLFFIFLFLTLINLVLWNQNPFVFTFIPFISAASFLCLIEIFRRKNELNHPLLGRIGQLSYSMYLIHFIFAWTIGYPLNEQVLVPLIGAHLTLLVTFIMCIVLTFLLALISEKIIERPFINLGRQIIAQRQKNQSKKLETSIET